VGVVRRRAPEGKLQPHAMLHAAHPPRSLSAVVAQLPSADIKLLAM
jgi:hypothetical protein